MKKLLYTLPLLLLLFISCSKDEYVKPDVKLQNDLANSTWVITRYDHALAKEPSYTSDTIHFINKKYYTINENDVKRRYDLTGKSTKYLRIFSLTTLGSDFSATLDEHSIDDGYLNSTIFNDLNVSDSMEHGYVLVWMHRLD